MEEKKNMVFQHAINWGLIVGLVMIAVNLLVYFAGMYSNKKIGLIIFVLYIGLIFFAQKNFKDSNPTIDIPYGKSFVVGLFVGLLTTVLLTIYNFSFFKFIAPEFLQNMIEVAKLKVIEMDLPASTEARVIDSQARFMTIGWITVFGFLGSVIQSVIAALVGALFAKGSGVQEDFLEDLDD